MARGRTLTVLVADVVGSTALFGRLGVRPGRRAHLFNEDDKTAMYSVRRTSRRNPTWGYRRIHGELARFDMRTQLTPLP